MIVRISDYIFRKEEKIKKGIDEVMGGKVLQLESERLFELGEARGKIIGKAEGKAEAILDLLSELGDVPDDIRKKVLAEKDEAKLKDMLFAASRASSFEEFAKNG